MNHFTLSLLLLLVTLLTATGCAAKDRTPIDRATVSYIATSKLKCSATKLGPQTLLSAAHCFRGAGATLNVDGALATIQHVELDQNDHALILLSGITLINFATFGDVPVEGDLIHYWGNPFIFKLLFRRGYVSGYYNGATLYDANGYRGDSGAGVFNDKNQLVGVISFIQGENSFAMMGSYPLNFTKDQLAAVNLTPDAHLMTGQKVEVNLRYPD